MAVTQNLGGGGVAVPISRNPNDLKLGRYSTYISWMQSVRGVKENMILALDPRPNCHYTAL